MNRFITLLGLLAITAGCATPRDLRGTWRLDVPACKAYYASVHWPHPVEEEWWQRGSHSRLQFSGSTMIHTAGWFAKGATNTLGTLHKQRIPFTLNSASNGTYKLTYFDKVFCNNVEMTFVVTSDRMEQSISREGVAIKYFWRKN